MKAFDSDPSLRWLFCMTHPDDEISICAWIQRLTQAGAVVGISWTHDTPSRIKEANAVADRLGIAADRRFFHHAADGDICDHLAELKTPFAEMMAAFHPDRVVCGAFEQGHLDHDSTNWLVNQTFDGPIFETPFYHTYRTRLPRMNRFADHKGVEVLKLTSAEQQLKKSVARSYPSQAIWRNLLWAEARARLTGDGSLTATEYLRLQTHRDFWNPHLPAALASRVKRTAKWLRWEEALRRVGYPPS